MTLSYIRAYIAKDRLMETNNHFSQGTSFTIQRKLENALLDTFTVFVKPEPTVKYHTWVIAHEEKTALADSKTLTIGITTSMLEDIDDKETSYIIGHEISHLLMKHSEKSLKNANTAETTGVIATGIDDILVGALFGGYRSSYTNAQRQRDRERGYFLYHKEFEREADYVGIYLSAMSGVEVDGVEDFWRRLHNTTGSLYSKTHPTHAERYNNMRLYVQEIEFKKDTGKPLLPDRIQK